MLVGLLSQHVCFVGVRRRKKTKDIRNVFYRHILYKRIYSFLAFFFDMASKTSNQSEPIQVNKHSTETGFDFPLSPTEPGKFDFYRYDYLF